MIDRPVVVFGDHTQILKLVDFDFVVGADGVKILMPRTFLDAKYLYYFLLGHPLKALGYARHYRLLKELDVEFPAPSEQKRIVAILDEAFAGIDAAIVNTENNLANAQELFQSYLTSSFILDGVCKKVLLEDVLSLQPRNGWSPPARNHSHDGTPVLTLSSVTGFQFRPEKIKHTSAEVNASRHYWVKEGSILITRSNTPELVGHVALASGLKEATIYPDLIMQMASDPSEAITEFLYFQLRSPVLRIEIMGRARGANPTMKKIGKKAVQTLPVFIPPIEDQKEIVRKIRAISDECEQLEKVYHRKLRVLKELKKSLLQKAFAGELTTKNIESEAREAMI